MTLRAQAYETFTRHLIDRQLQPGQFVTQRELAALTGFPLGAIREMIPRLEAEGLICTIPQRGLQVAKPDVHLVRDAFQFREIIEAYALTHFIQTATDAAIAAQRAALDRVKQAAAGGIGAEVIADAQAVDWGFHDALVDSLGNRLLSDAHRVNAIRIRMMLPERTTLSADTLPPAVAEHEAIIAALERRDAAAAQAAMRAHLAHARRRALAIEPEPVGPQFQENRE